MTPEEITLIENIYDAFANWYHDDGSHDNYLKSEAFKRVTEYASRYASIVSAEKDKEIAELRKRVNDLTLDNMTHEFNNAEAERFAPEYESQIREDESEKRKAELAAAKERIAELEKEVNRLTMDNMTHEYNNAEAERFAPEHQKQIIELAQSAFEYALDNRFSRHPGELWVKFMRDNNLL